MKKALFLAAAVAAMAACTKSQTVYDGTETEIGLAPVNYMSTKTYYGPYPGAAYSDAEQFRVFAQYTKEPAGTAFKNNDEHSTYLDNVTFSKKSSQTGGVDVWGGDPTPYYWPKSGSLYFAGYSPAGATLNGDAGYEFNTGGSRLTLPGFTQGDYSNAESLDEISGNTNYKMVDLLYFDVEANTPSVNEGIYFATFKHALSWIEFRITCTTGLSDLFQVKKITLNDVSFTETFSSGAGDPWDVEPEWTGNKTNIKDIVIYDHQFNDGADSDLDDAILADSKYLCINGLLLIPQDVTSITLELEQKGSADQEFVEVNPETISLVSTIGSGSDVTTCDKWEIGKHYVYTLSISAEEILINPKVDDWTVEIPNTIPVD